MQAMRNDLRHWIVGLGAAVLACFGAIGWRILTMPEAAWVTSPSADVRAPTAAITAQA